ncbi:MAG: hypothetical protein NVS9B13_06080 [Candidatus Acidiferrum sp.]
MSAHVTRFGMLAFVTLLASGALATDKLSELQARFDRETKGVAKGKLLQKLGDAQFAAARVAGHDGDYNTSGLILEKYRDNARAAVEALKKQESDAERHPNGFRQAEIEVRRGIREVDETLLVTPDVYRPPLQLVRQDLIAMDDELLRALFPRRREPQTVPPSTQEKRP